MTTLATIADTTGGEFCNHYSMVMPYLLNILKTSTGKELRVLRGKAVECMSLVALAVGKPHFIKDARETIQIMEIMQGEATDSDDPSVAYLLAAWARICAVLGNDFMPYLDQVMKPLLVSASYAADIAVLDIEEDSEARGFNQEDGWNFTEIDGQVKNLYD